MQDVSRAQRQRRKKGSKIGLASKIGLQVNFGRDRASRAESEGYPKAPAFSTGLFKKRRKWQFQTKPAFKKIKGPLVDVFHEAKEVLIVIDLGGFRPGDVCLSMHADRYTIIAKRGEQEFHKEIELPQEVDVERCVEHFKNGVLEIVLPRKETNTG